MNTFSDKASTERTIARKTRAGAPTPAFAGPGHTAAEILRPDRLAETDPFVMLMDDRLDFKPGQRVGEEHPHAGIETVTLLLDGSLNDPAAGLLQTGDVEWMTAGRGVVHGENVEATGYARILQLWVALPKNERDGEPDLQVVPFGALPIRREPGVEARLYSGRTGDLVSPTRNRVPMTVVDFLLEPYASITQSLPGGDTAFLFVVEGGVLVSGEALVSNDVAWLNRVDETNTFFRLEAGPAGARVILYAGAPLDEPIVQRGPFVSGSDAELAERFAAYRAGMFQRLSEVAGIPLRADQSSGGKT
jgi:hypothetical protein